jgi:hypothetical protein
MQTQKKARTIVDACVLYDPSTGRIAHTHQIVAYGNRKAQNESDVEAECVLVAKQMGHHVEQMKTLRVSPDDRKPGVAYKVDVATKNLVAQRPAKK